MVTEATPQTFAELTEEGLVVVKFWAPWCGPCVDFAPTFEEAAEVAEGRARFVTANTDECWAAALDANVVSLPAVAVYEDGAWLASVRAGGIGSADALLALVGL